MARNQPVGLAALAILVSGILAPQTVKIQGVIKTRSGATVIVQTADSPELVVLLTDGTQVGQAQEGVQGEAEGNVDGRFDSRPSSPGRRNLQRTEATRGGADRVPG
jgi:hypothetical protein